ncbi:hypothetical protein MAR_027748 [Mya arenaria]|uniref:YqaJ viral recombinase domain-containing protein n=1 Tax=Mya arenaria TaxID=6604 RepID=A0ABY7EYH0_MYAAR|nr:hypothetical protein MAR_027748 [Mya arenaria]
MTPILIGSPDGSVRRKGSEIEKQKIIAVIELKCPVLDCLAEIEVLEVDQLIYVSWRYDISTVFVVKGNKQLFEKAYGIAKQLYLTETSKRPTKVQE